MGSSKKCSVWKGLFAACDSLFQAQSVTRAAFRLRLLIYMREFMSGAAEILHDVYRQVDTCCVGTLNRSKTVNLCNG